MRVKDIGGLLHDHSITAVPSPISEFVGLVGLKVGLVPVYSLAALLGHNDTEGQGWLVLCGTSQPFALCFGGFEGYAQIPASKIFAAATAGLHVGEVAQTQDTTRLVVSVPSLTEAIKTLCGNVRRTKES
jgi:hypothetical protein